jgi:Domain of unknown function DUF29
MPDDLYERDVLAWSESQAALLRRLARGERVNDVDWAHVVEEIEDVGLSELNAVRSYLRLIITHLLKLRSWPDDPAAPHWRGEVVTFQRDAAQRFAPSMRQRIDLERLYRDAVAAVTAIRSDDSDQAALPGACPFTPEQLLTEVLGALVATARDPADE